MKLLLMILGPTSTGKSELAMAVARERNGEIVSGDAFAAYRGLDIGTAKPNAASRDAIPHHMLDVADPTEEFSAGRWVREARDAIGEIQRRGKLPIVCGGSGFYVRSLLSGLPGTEVRWPAIRSWLSDRLAAGGGPGLARMLQMLDPAYARHLDARDSARLSRALEVIFATGRPISERRAIGGEFLGDGRVVKVARRLSKEELYARISRRVEAMLAAGWAEEVAGLLRAGVSPASNSFRAIGYRELAAVERGALEYDEAREKIVRATWQLARRQRIWLSREPNLQWLTSDDPLREVLAALDLETREAGRA
jgi:tRNA dimethylallyltransferase